MVFYFLYYFSIFCFIYYNLNLPVSLICLLFALDLVCSSFSSFIRFKIRLLIWDFLLLWAFVAMSFSLSITWTAFYKFWFCVFVFIQLQVFSNIQCDFFFDSLSKSMLIFTLFLNFPIYLLLIFNVIRNYDYITYFVSLLLLNLLRLVSWPKIWFILKDNKFHKYLKSICILMFLGEMVYRHPLSLIGL